MDVRAAIAVERRRIADLVDGLDAAQLDRPSLCGDWTVKQVAAHLLAAVEFSPGAALRTFVRCGFRLHRANAQIAVSVARRPATELADGLRRHAETDFRPPVVGYPGQLTDLQVHGQDMRRPLGLPHGLTPDGLRASLTFLTGGRAPGFTSRRRLSGLRLAASDLPWTWGSGALVTGPAEALMMAMTGRPVALAELDGLGVRTLAHRIS
nr:maleylpyruvate isomerase family mycothiol-dependent enzyme [uncultured Actinoplanes sp.]